MKSLAVVALCASLVASGCGGGGGTEEAKPKPVPGERGSLYDIRGDLLYPECAGYGEPTVVLEAGLGGDHRDWHQVDLELARTTRVCGYDRSGVAYSLNGRKHATADEKVEQLNELLDVAHVDGPYVLVGHSFGGMLVRLYTAEHGDDVDGVVLVESSSPDQDDRLLAALPRPRAGENPRLAELRKAMRDTRNAEGVNWRKASEQVHGTRWERSVPLVVITAGQNESPPDLPYRDRLADTWFSLQRELARLSANSIHVVATNSGHFVQSNLGQPDLVVRAIREVIAAVRGKRHLRPCEAVFPAAGRRCLSP